MHSAGTTGERQLIHVLKEYVSHFKLARAAPGDCATHPGVKGAGTWDAKDKQVIEGPVLNGLHHAYRWVAT
jgi:hypothetical protein